MTDDRSKKALRVARQFANDDATEDQRAAAWAAGDAARAAGDAAWAAGAAAWAAGDAAWAAAWAAGAAARAAEVAWQTNRLRELLTAEKWSPVMKEVA